MNQNDSPNPTDIGGETPAPETATALVTFTPKPEVTAEAKPERNVDAVAPDPFAVGVRVLRMAPAWLLSVTAGCSLLIILLGWMNPGGMAHTVAYAPATNDARPAAHVAQKPAPARPAEATRTADSPENASSAPESAPAPSPEHAAAPAPEPPAEVQPATPAAPQPAEEQARPEAPAAGADAAGQLTVQVGSFNNSSEANERVSNLRNAGFETRAVAVELPGRGTWYRVHVGRFADRAEAAKTLASLRAKGAAGMVVPVQD